MFVLSVVGRLVCPHMPVEEWSWFIGEGGRVRWGEGTLLGWYHWYVGLAPRKRAHSHKAHLH